MPIYAPRLSQVGAIRGDAAMVMLLEMNGACHLAHGPYVTSLLDHG